MRAVPEPSHLEPWLTKKELAHHFSCSVRWIERQMAEGLPSTMIAGRQKFKASDAEAWLDKHGEIRRYGDR